MPALGCLQVNQNAISIGGKQTFQCVTMRDFLTELAKKIKRNTTAFDNYERMYLPPRETPSTAEGAPLKTNVLYKHIQKFLKPEHAIIAETGDSWFNCQKLQLPEGCKYEFQVSILLSSPLAMRVIGSNPVAPRTTYHPCTIGRRPSYMYALKQMDSAPGA